MTRARIALLALLGLATACTREKTSATDAGSAPPLEASTSAVKRERFPRPIEAFAELAVLSERPFDEVAKLATAEGVAAMLGPKHCGEACDAVRAFVRNADRTTIEVRQPSQWGLPPPDRLPFATRSLGDAERARIAKRQSVVVVRAHGPGDVNQLAARTGFGAAAALADKLDGFVYDEEVRRIENAAQAAAHAIASPLGAPAFRTEHIAVQIYTQPDGSARALTLGMRRFGAPDLEARGAAMHAGKALGLLLDAAAAKIAGGASETPLAIGEQDLARVRPAGGKPATGAVDFELVTPPHTAGDPDNPMLSLLPPGGQTREAFDRALETLFGKLDVVVDEANDPALVEAAKRAREKLPGALARWKREEKSGTEMMVKLPFAFEPPERDGGPRGPNLEWMWVQVTGFDESSITGTLANTPAYATNLKLGSSVKGKRSDVADWMIRSSDGGLEGGESVRILEARTR
jgi:uncharacterized protein YegJ (DUF2314 family)